jgi:hypothetical protein
MKNVFSKEKGIYWKKKRLMVEIQSFIDMKSYGLFFAPIREN